MTATTDSDKATHISAAISGQGRLSAPSPARAVEVVVAWGQDTLLHVAHLSPPRSFYMGEPRGRSAREPASDFVMNTHELGVSRLPVLLEHAGRVSVVIPAGATVYVQLDGATLTARELDERGLLEPARELPGARCYALVERAQVRVAYLGLSVFVRYTEAAPAPPRAGSPRGLLARQRWQLASFGLHSLLLGSFYFLPPSASALSIDRLNMDNHFIQYHLAASQAPVLEDKPSWLGAANGGQSPAAADDEGQRGDRSAPARQKRYAVRGSQTRNTPQPETLTPSDARQQGILGILRALAPGAQSNFAREQAEGRDLQSELGTLLTGDPGRSSGMGGLGMVGTGVGGGGTARGTIGSGPLVTLGSGAGGGTGRGWGPGAGDALRSRTARVPRVRAIGPEVRGSLSKEVIRRQIHRHLNEVRFCYEQRLISRPDLQGRVAVRFMIGSTGAVQLAALASSDLGDRQVGECIRVAVKRWVFPAPEGGGAVAVTYPFVLSQTSD